MSLPLDGKTVAVLVADGFEEEELTEPVKALKAAGANVKIVSPGERRVRGWRHTDWGAYFDVDVTIDGADSEDFEALLLPGGVMSPDKIRIDSRSIEFVRAFIETGKPVAAICHGPWTLINAEAVRGRKVTSYPSIRLDLENAGAHWVDQEVVVDNGLVTSRKPADIPAFNRKMIEEFAEGVHPRE